MANHLRYCTGGSELLDHVESLWELQREFHVERSRYFAAQLAARTFVGRKAELLRKGPLLHVELAVDDTRNEPVAYCISTIDAQRCGEIDSLFVVDRLRGQGIGRRLTEAAIAWMDACGAEYKTVCVADGNESALRFYEKFGFVPRQVQLVHVPRHDRRVT